jgi:hypothetical protein
LDLLILLVIATFIIVAVFVGYHASQESREKMSELHGKTTELDMLDNQTMKTIHALYINTELR